VKRVRETVNPEPGAERSIFFQLAERGGSQVLIRVLVVIIPALIAPVLLTQGFDNWLAYWGLQTLLVYASFRSWRAASRYHSPWKSRQIIEAVASLFHAANYHVTLEPTSSTTDDLGPLLSVVDMIAESPDRAFIVEVKQYENSDRIDRMQASNLQTTAWTLSRYKERLGVKAETFYPLMVFVGRQADPVTRDFSQANGIVLIEIAEDMLKQIEKSNPVQLRKLAHEILSPSLIEPSAASSAPAGSLQGLAT
jgi:hypothetical protein